MASYSFSSRDTDCSLQIGVGLLACPYGFFEKQEILFVELSNLGRNQPHQLPILVLDGGCDSLQSNVF